MAVFHNGCWLHKEILQNDIISVIAVLLNYVFGWNQICAVLFPDD